MKKKIVDLEKESFRAELGTSVYVITATCLLRFGIGTVALAGATLLYEGKLDVLTFSNVRFSYEEGETVLSDISFTAKQGKVTALIEPSGGGKSTVSKLAARFWDTDGGKITLGGKDISKVNPAKLLAQNGIYANMVRLQTSSTN